MIKCPYCGRKLVEHERYCYFCEQDLSKVVDALEKPNINPKPYDFKADIEKVKRISKIVVDKAKKKFKKGNVASKEEKTQKPIIAFCVKCNKKVNIKNPRIYTMKSNRVAVRGVCPFCSTETFRILGMKANKSKKDERSK